MSTSHKERAASPPDPWWSRGRRAVSLDLLRRQLASGEAKRALVLGAGAEALCAELKPLCQEVRCLEAGSVSQLEERQGPLPFEDERFDLICALDVLSEAADDSALICELRRILSPEGLLLLAVPAHPWLYSDDDEGPRRRYTRRSLAKLLTECELTTERNTYANSLLFALMAPATLAARLVDVPNERHLPIPRLADELCYQAFAAERFLSRHVDLPLGQTLVAIARRRESTGWLKPARARESILPKLGRVQTACC